MSRLSNSILAVALLGAACSDKQPDAVTPLNDEPAPKAAMEFKPTNVDLLQDVPASIFANEVITLRPTAGHHFELKAPQRCAEFELTVKSPRVIACQITAPGTHRIELSVCDDDKKYCKLVKFEIEATAPRGFDAAAAATKVLEPPKQEHAAVPGFVMNDTAAAIAAAKKDGKLLFVHFYGIWCPPCNMLEEQVYGAESFLEATDNMVRVMIDADSDLSWEWKAHFKIGGYPTVVVANADLQEIDRVVGFRPVAAMNGFARRATELASEPVSVLAERHAADPANAPADVRKRVGLWHHERAEFDEALRWLDGVEDREAVKTIWLARSAIARRDGDTAAQDEATEALARDFRDDVEFPIWARNLIRKDRKRADELLGLALQALDDWDANPGLDESGWSRADLAWVRATLHEAVEQPKEAKAAYLRAADFYEEQARSSSLEVARGANLERAHALHKAGEHERAKLVFEELVDKYSDEFTFTYNYAGTLEELGELDKAYEYAKRAEQSAYGDNHLRAVHRKAKIENTLGRPNDALATIDAALADAVVPKSTAVRTHRYIGALRDLRAEVTAQPPK